MKNITFGKRLRELRKQKGYTSQKAFAEAIGMAQSTINFYERDERKPDIETFKTIADFFDVSYDYLLGESDDPARDKRNTIVEIPIIEAADEEYGESWQECSVALFVRVIKSFSRNVILQPKYMRRVAEHLSLYFSNAAK